MENFLVHYATYNWQNLLLDISSEKKLLKIASLIFGALLLIAVVFYRKSNKRKLSKFTQTDFISPIIKAGNENTFEAGDFLLNYIFNHNLCFTHIVTSWISNFNDFQMSNIVSKKCHIIGFNKDRFNEFKCSEVKIVENKEIFSFTFQMSSSSLSLDASLKYDSKMQRTGSIILTNLEIMVLVIVRVGAKGLLMKFCPEFVSRLDCQLIIDGISGSEKEMSVTEFKRDFKLVIMQTIEMEWGGQLKQCPSEDEINRVDQCCQVDISTSENNISNPRTNDDRSESIDTNEFIEAQQYYEVNEEKTPQNKTMVKEDCPGKLMSQSSLFTTDSYDCYEHGEVSPFHDRFTSKLVGRTLVVALVKVIEAQELRIPLKKGYCVLELDEPYQRHVSHLISLGEYPVWNQHFIFSLNSNSQRISVELFQASKKCQSPISLGISLIPISSIIIGQSGNSFPINVNHFGSRASWRCDTVVGALDSKIPAFVMEFQIMKNIEDPQKSYVEPSSERSSSSGIFVTNEVTVKSADTTDPSLDNGTKMQTIPEVQASSSGNTRSDDPKVSLRQKTGEEHRSKSMIRKLRNRFSQLSAPWTTGKSKSDDCLDQISNEDPLKPDPSYIVPVQPPTELFMSGAKSKLFSKHSESELVHSRGLSSSLKKMLSFPTKKYDKSLENLFKEMDSKLFDTISKEGFDRIMNDDCTH